MPGPGLAAVHPDVAGLPSQVGPDGLQHTINQNPAASHAHSAYPQHQQNYSTSSNIFEHLDSHGLAHAAANEPHHSAHGEGNDTNETHSQNSNDNDTISNLFRANNELRTRVSELEFVNDLFQGRVKELEASEKDLRQRLAAHESSILEEEDQQENPGDIERGQIAGIAATREGASVEPAQHGTEAGQPESAERGSPHKKRRTRADENP